MREALRQAAGSGLNVLRTFAHTTDDNFPFQVGGAARCIDYAVSEMSAQQSAFLIVAQLCNGS